MIVTLAGIDLTAEWDIASLSEWWGLPAARSEVVLRSQADGGLTPSRTLRDVVRPSAVLRKKSADASSAAAAVAVLNATVARGLVPLTVDPGSGPTTRMVEVQGVQVSSAFEWWNLPVAVDMVAFDPFRYGPRVCSPLTGLPLPGGGLVFPLGASPFLNWGAAPVAGRASLPNAGSESTPVEVTVRDLLPSGFELTEIESGRRLRWDRPLGVGQSVVLDPRTRRATLDGQSDVTAALSIAEWFEIPAGGTRTYAMRSLGSTSGSPTFQACAAPAYL